MTTHDSHWNGEHPDRSTLDKARCELLTDAALAAVRRHLASCAPCRETSAFGSHIAREFGAAPLPHARRTRSRLWARVRWPRVAIAGSLAMALVGLAVIAPWSASVNGASPPAQTADETQVAQHPGFYAWLAAHPELMQPGSDHGDAA